jgi:hypothetical protein
MFIVYHLFFFSHNKFSEEQTLWKNKSVSHIKPWKLWKLSFLYKLGIHDELDDSIFKTQSTFIDINAFEIDIDEILDPLLPSSESSNQGSGQTNVLKTGEKVFINISQW